MTRFDSSPVDAITRLVRAFGWTFLLVVGSSFFATADEAFIRGDVNLDGQINLGDVSRLIASFRADGTALECEDAADVNDDGEVTYLSPETPGAPESDVDALLDLLKSVSLVGPPPGLAAPFPEAGEDPTADGLGCGQGVPTELEEATWGLSWTRDALTGDWFITAATNSLPIAGGVDGLSLALLVESEASLAIAGPVDFEGTVFPNDLRERFEASRFFKWRFHPTEEANLELLTVVALFVTDETDVPAPIDYPLTRETRILRVVTTRDMNLPDFVSFLLGEDADDYPYAGPFDELGGLRSAFTRGDSVIHFEGDPGLIEPDGLLFVRGDSNADRVVGMDDAVHTLEYLFVGGDRAILLDAADANDDEVLDIADPLLTLFHLVGLASLLPEPYPLCGCDPDKPFSELLSDDEGTVVGRLRQLGLSFCRRGDVLELDCHEP